MKVRTIDADGSRWIVKTPSTTEDAARLRHEAAQLQRAAHPGVVELAAAGDRAGIEVRTRDAGTSLRQHGPMPAAELCGLGAAVATVLADLHDIGIVHGAVNADHILIGPDGHPVLCGFGASTSTEEGDATLDTRGLTATLAGLVGPDAPRRLVRVLRQDRPVRRSTTSARALATALAAAMPDRRLPRPPVAPVAGRGDRLDVDEAGLPRAVGAPAPEGEAPAPDRPSVRRAGLGRPSAGPPESPAPSPSPSRYRIGGAVLVAVIVVAVLAVTVGRSAGHRRAVLVPCPSVDRGCGPLPVHDGAFVTAAGTFTTGLPDPVVVLGRFACGTASLPAALDPETGRIWTWPTWAGPARSVTATPVTAPSGATTLRVRPGASGCDQLEVIDAAGTTTVLGSTVLGSTVLGSTVLGSTVRRGA